MRLLAAGLALLTSACASTDWQNLPMPGIAPGASVEMRVLVADNPRLAKMTDAQLAQMLESARRTSREHFAVDLRFAAPVRMPIKQLFANIPEPVRQARAAEIYDFKTGQGDRRKLAGGIVQTLSASGSRLEDMVAFARPHVPGIRGESTPELAESLATVLLDRLEAWKKVTAPDGRPVIDERAYNEATYWDSIGYGKLPYELILTNQLIASAEYVGADVHSSIRGGVTVGITQYSRSSRHRTAIVWSTFAYLDPSETTVAMRGGERYSDEEAARLAGVYLTHEIGHFLFHYAHPFDKPACVMNPVRMLQFRAAAEALDATKCRDGGYPEMKPGAARIPFNRKWERMAEGLPEN